MAVFQETQYISPWVKWPTVVISGGLVIFAIAFGGEPEEGSQWLPLMIALIGGLIAITTILILRLNLRINREGIEYKMFPLEWKVKRIRADEIESMEVKKLGWLPFYGGFGRRRRLARKEVAYILNRKAALFVILKNGKRRTFTTNQEAKLKRFVNNYLESRTNHTINEEV